MTTTESVRKELKTLEDPTYREFHSSLIPGANNILGVRIPQLRIMAKGLAKKEDWRTFVEATDTQYYEETMLQGMIIGLAKMEPGRTNPLYSPLRPAYQQLGRMRYFLR